MQACCNSQLPHISPHSAMTTWSLGLLLGPVITFSILRITSMPSPSIRPNTTCLLSSQSVFACAAPPLAWLLWYESDNSSVYG